MAKLHPQLGKIGIVLPGGSTRGAFQVGALKAFDENRIIPSYIVGVSGGAINATAFAAGRISSFWKIYQETAKKPRKYIYGFNFHTLLRAFFWSKSILVNHPLKKQLKKQLSFQEFISSGIKVDIITTDFQSGEEVIFSNKNPEHQDSELLANAILASCAIPVIFPPFIYKNHQLFDGGVLEKTPLTFAIKENCDTVFLINNEPHQNIKTEKHFDTIYPIARRAEELTTWRSTKRDIERTFEINDDINNYEKIKNNLLEIIKEKLKNYEFRQDIEKIIADSLGRATLSFQKKRSVRILIIEPDRSCESHLGKFFNPQIIPRYLQEGYDKTIKILRGLNLIY